MMLASLRPAVKTRLYGSGKMEAPCSSALANAHRDLKAIQSTNNHVKQSRIYQHHTAIVNDVQYHPLHKSLIGTVSDDLTLQILDVRQAETDRSSAQARGHTDAINALAFNSASEFVLA